MKLEKISLQQYEDRIYYLKHVAGVDLRYELQRAQGDGNYSKVVEVLRNHQKWSGECAKYLERSVLSSLKSNPNHTHPATLWCASCEAGKETGDTILKGPDC